MRADTRGIARLSKGGYSPTHVPVLGKYASRTASNLAK